MNRVCSFLILAACVVATAVAGVVTCDNAATGGAFSQDFNGLCVAYYQESGGWNSAAASCENRGGYLAYPRNADMSDGMQALSGNARGWIGVMDMTTEGDFTTHGWGDKLIDFTYWDGGEPNNVGGEDCVELRGFTSKWNDLPCGHAIGGYFCEFPVIQHVDDQAACSAFVDDYLIVDAAFQNGECVFIPNNAKDWSGGDDYCKNFLRNGEPASLVKIGDQDYNDLVDSLNRPAWSDNPWIGAHDIGAENTFVWGADGSMVDCQFTNWAPGEPNDLRGEDCVHILSSGQWNDLGCENYQGYVCGWPTPNTCDTHIFDDDCADVTVTVPGNKVGICFADGGEACL